ncbi:MAG: right-handed parallel beta-helix repeat-containing protein [Acidobacteriota bacterium]
MKRTILALPLAIMMCVFALTGPMCLYAQPVNSLIRTISTTTSGTATNKTGPTAKASAYFNTFYVAPYGNDRNPGTKDRPFKTIQKAADSVTAGSTVLIRQGTYNEIVTLKTSGNKGNYITYRNYPGETATLNGKGLWDYDWDGVIRTNCQNYIIIEGLKIINSCFFGISTSSWRQYEAGKGSSHLIIRNCYTYNTKSSGICISGGYDVTVEGNTIERACQGGLQECITFSTVNTFIARKNKISNGAKEGIDANEGCINGQICYNNITKVHSVGIYIDSYSKHQNNIEVYGNRISSTNTGIAAASEKGGLLENVKIHHNVVYNCNWGLAAADWGHPNPHPLKNIYFTNNTMYNIKTAYVEISNTKAVNVVVTNNIFGRNSDPYTRNFYVQTGQKNFTIDHNLYFKLDSTSPKGKNYLVGDPGFVNPSASDFRLKSKSKAIKAGIGSVNLGAF